MKRSLLTINSSNTPTLSDTPIVQPAEILIQLGLMISNTQEQVVPAKGGKQNWKEKLDLIAKRLTIDSSNTPTLSDTPIVQPEEILIKLGLMTSNAQEQIVPTLTKPDAIDNSNQFFSNDASTEKIRQNTSDIGVQPRYKEPDNVTSPRVITNSLRKKPSPLLYAFASSILIPLKQKYLVQKDKQKDSGFDSGSIRAYSVLKDH